MGVDYEANYGIGVEVSDLCFDELDYDDVHEYLYDKLKGSEYKHIEEGEETYTDYANTHYIVIPNPFEQGVDGLVSKIEKFYRFLKIKDIAYTGKVDVVGGLHIC